MSVPFTSTDLDREVRIERPVADDALDGAGSGSWLLVTTVAAQVRDILPSRSEDATAGMPSQTRRARVRMWFLDDINPDMRFVMGNRIMQIISGPAELGRREGLEFMVEDYRPAGNPA